jgi:hypothetical protein
LALTAAGVGAAGAGGPAPATGTPTAAEAAAETAALAAVTTALTAVSKGDTAALKQCLAEQLLGVAVDPATGAAHPLVLQRDDVLASVEQGGGHLDLLAGRQIVDMTAQAGPGEVVLVTYKLATGNADADRALPPVGPFWVLLGKFDGQWRILSFTLPMPAPQG